MNSDRGPQPGADARFEPAASTISIMTPLPPLTPTQVLMVLERVAADAKLRVSQIMAILESFSRHSAQVQIEADVDRAAAARAPADPRRDS